MTNIEIRDFATVQGVTDTDYVVLSLYGGSSAKMAVGLFSSNMKAETVPSIKDGIWWIGTTNTEVQAEGKTPEFRKGTMGIEWKYTSEADTAWKLLVGLEEIRFRFEELTAEQRKQVALKFSDLTEAEIAELQKPANDMIDKLEKTNEQVQAAEDARVEEYAQLKADCVAATEDAQDTADHPTYVGTDNYVYKWNKETQAYDKTSVYVRGEAFSIKKVYSSVSAMYADPSTAFKEGDFCLINTGDVENPENAQLFVRTSTGSWDFLVDMSGAIGFTGKTPQMFIGTVSIGSGKDSAAVTLSAAGTDSDGNPKYNINYVIPCLAYEDLTAEQIAELQKPANDMIAQLKATDDAVKAAEAARVTAENTRVASENTRIANENIRKENEEARIAGEDERKAAEAERKDAETVRKSNENARIANEQARSTAENARAAAEEQRKESEASRKEAENTRESNENTRIEAENVRIASEEERIAAEEERIASEQTRKANEDTRIAAENVRIATENTRNSSEEVRRANENERVANEQARVEAENARAAAEAERVATDDARKEDYAALKADLVANSQIMLVSETEYEDAVDSGTIDETKLYFAYEE